MIKKMSEKHFLLFLYLGVLFFTVMLFLTITYYPLLTSLVSCILSAFLSACFTFAIIDKYYQGQEKKNNTAIIDKLKDVFLNFLIDYYWFLVNIVDSEKSKVVDNSKDALSTYKGVLQRLSAFKDSPYLYLQKILKDGVNIYSDRSCSYFKNAEGLFYEVKLLLDALPKTNIFYLKLISDYISLRSCLFQTRDSLCAGVKDSDIDDALVHALTKDVVKYGNLFLETLNNYLGE